MPGSLDPMREPIDSLIVQMMAEDHYHVCNACHHDDCERCAVSCTYCGAPCLHRHKKEDPE